jgi:hypothetical protein
MTLKNRNVLSKQFELYFFNVIRRKLSLKVGAVDGFCV